MSVITGTNSAETLTGTKGDDTVTGNSGDDVLFGGRGNDLLVGGSGSDVLFGGLDADTFRWSAGHITDGATDYVADFSLLSGDLLSFLSSGGGQDVSILGVSRSFRTDTTANGVDLQNNIASGTDIVFTVQNSVTGATQEIVLLDAWSASISAQWDAYLATLGTSFGGPVA